MTPDLGAAPRIDRVTGPRLTAGADTTRPAFAWEPAAFATGLSFVADGRFTGTMRPLTVETATVPLPAGLPLLASGLALLLLRGQRNRGPADQTPGRFLRRVTPAG